MSRILLVLSLFFSGPIWADGGIYTGTFSNNAAGGYDTVSFFEGSKPVKGTSKFKTEHKGANWLFSNQTNLDKFVADPDKYVPQYGGHCSWAIAAKDALAEGNPKHWAVVNDKLYLNYSGSTFNDWKKNIDGFIARGDINWAKK